MVYLKCGQGDHGRTNKPRRFKIDNVQKAIDLAHEVNSKVEDITFEKIRSNDNGEYLWSVTDISNNTTRYVIEGSTGTLILVDEGAEEDAVELWNNK